MKSNAHKRRELAPARLAEKLRQIRADHNLSQGKLLIIVNPTEFTEGNRARISQYEKGQRVPSLIEVHNYSLFADIPLETLIDDQLDLPALTRQPPDEQQETPDKEIAEEITEEITDAGGQTLPLPVEDVSPTTPATCPMPLRSETLQRCRLMYFELLAELPFNRCSYLSFDDLLEQMLSEELSDYTKRQSNSAIASRVRQLIEQKSGEINSKSSESD